MEAVYYNSHNDFTWQNTVLLAPLCNNDDDAIIRKKIGATATYLDIWLMRRVVNYIRVGYSSASYTMYLLCRDIRKTSLTDLIDILAGKLAEDEVTFEGSPARGRLGIDDLRLNQFSRRYIYHLLARITAFTEIQSGRSEDFDKLVDRNVKNPFDIEHIWSGGYRDHADLFSTEQEFHDWRNHIASLLLLPADVNRSLQDKTFAEKVPHYAKQNFYAASLANSVYEHQPRFRSFLDEHGLPFRAVASVSESGELVFDKDEQKARRKLVRDLVRLIWSPDRLKEFAA